MRQFPYEKKDCLATMCGSELLDHVDWFNKPLSCAQSVHFRESVPVETCNRVHWQDHHVVGWFLQCSFIGQLLRSFMCLLRMFPIPWNNDIDMA